MKAILCLLVCLMLFCSGCALNELIEIPPAKDGKPHQVILVKYTGGSKATLTWYSATNRLLMTCPAYVGQNGMGKFKEGDRRTPLGEFSILGGFGIQANPGTKIKYIEATDSLYLCKEKINYNRLISDPVLRHSSACEQIVAYRPEYHYGIFIDYNKKCVFGNGSGIFIHCTGIHPYTTGSIAIDELYMVELLRGIEPTVRIIIYKDI